MPGRIERATLERCCYRIGPITYVIPTNRSYRILKQRLRARQESAAFIVMDLRSQNRGQTTVFVMACPLGRRLMRLNGHCLWWTTPSRQSVSG